MRRLKEGDIVQHFKREEYLIKCHKDIDDTYVYQIVCFATHTETNEMMVVYKALYNSENVHCGDVFVRPYKMFMGLVDKSKYPNIHQKYRFELLKQKTSNIR